MKVSFQSVNKMEQREILPAGKYNAKIYGVFDVGIQQNHFEPGKQDHQIAIGFALCDKEGKALIHNEKSAFGSDDIGEQKTQELKINRPRTVKKVGSIKSSLRVILEELMPHNELKRLEDEGADLDLKEFLVGKNVTLTLTEYTNKDNMDKNGLSKDGVRECEIECESKLADTYIPGLVKHWIKNQIVT